MAKSTAYYNSCVNAPLLLLPRLDPFFFFHEKYLLSLGFEPGIGQMRALDQLQIN